MDYRQEFLVEPGAKVKLARIDPSYAGRHLSEDKAKAEIEKYRAKLTEQQLLMYAEKKHSVLIVLQALDGGGKDGTVNHVMSAMNPQGTTVTAFKVPTALELEHDFLWRVHPHAPSEGSVAIFNRSHYEDVLVVRVHQLAPKEVWSERYELINDFERLLYRQNNTHIIKFFLHISKDEQLERFKQRLDDPARNWKISESDYKERLLWDDYMKAFEDVFARTSTKHAPWYIIPSNHKWFRNLAVSQIVAATMEDLGMKMPMPTVDLDVIRREYYQARGDEDRKEPAGKQATRSRRSTSTRKKTSKQRGTIRQAMQIRHPLGAKRLPTFNSELLVNLMLLQTRRSYGNNFANHPDPVAYRGFSRLAVQPQLGLLPQRRTGTGPDHRYHPALNGPHLRP